jgi:hypothetical protein
MTVLAQTTAARFTVIRTPEVVIHAIRRIRAQNEELDPQAVESQENNQKYDRRKSRRIQLRMPITIIPVEDVGDGGDLVEVCGEEQIAVTRDISSQGLGILHDYPLLAEEAIIHVDIPGEDPISLLYEVRWSVRKTRYSHMSGGRLTGIVIGVDDDSPDV